MTANRLCAQVNRGPRGQVLVRGVVGRGLRGQILVSRVTDRGPRGQVLVRRVVDRSPRSPALVRGTEDLTATTRARARKINSVSTIVASAAASKARSHLSSPGPAALAGNTANVPTSTARRNRSRAHSNLADPNLADPNLARRYLALVRPLTRTTPIAPIAASEHTRRNPGWPSRIGTNAEAPATGLAGHWLPDPSTVALPAGLQNPAMKSAATAVARVVAPATGSENLADRNADQHCAVRKIANATAFSY
jgi:hypothetical protein